jgi:hypothetical protein
MLCARIWDGHLCFWNGKIKRQIKQLQEHLKWYKNWDNDDKNDCESGSSNNNYW